MRRKRWLAAILAAGTACTALFGCGSRQIVSTEMARSGESSEKELQAWEEAKHALRKISGADHLYPRKDDRRQSFQYAGTGHL